jgi:CRISPR-associated endonuclease Csn1
MKKILGLDIGPNSIGWAIITEDVTKGTQLVDAGVRIISAETNFVKEFERGQAISKNAGRRIKRGIRRSGQRYKLRKKKLIEKLWELGMAPTEELMALSTVMLYKLRDKAAKGEQLSLEEIGRIFYQLNQKRGYKSNRKANIEEQEDIEAATPTDEAEEIKPKKIGYLDEIALRETELKVKGLTIGQYFYHKLKINPNFRIKENIYTRESYIEEFNQIWEAQKAYHPTVLTDENLFLIRDRIIYYQRRLKSQKHLVNKCRFEKRVYIKDGKPAYASINACTKSAPIFQVFKIWQQINNVEVSNVNKIGEDGFDALGNRKLSIEEKTKLYTALDNAKELKAPTVLRKILKLNPNDGFILNYEKLDGNTTKAAISKALEKANIKKPELLEFNPNNAIKNEIQPFFKLWHLLYSIEEPKYLISALIKQFGFTETEAKTIGKTGFKNDYGSLSEKSIRKLLPELMSGYTYDKACEHLSEEVGNIAYREQKLTLAEKMDRDLADEIKPIAKNSLRQPIVEQVVNQVINLVNEVIGDGGLVTKEERKNDQFEIRVELARELKASIKQRAIAFKRNKESRDKNDKIFNRLQSEFNIKHPSLSDIEKFKLWEELGHKSPYTFQTIALADLFNKKQKLYEIEHIIPKSRLFDDSLMNKTIAEVSENSKKGNMTAYEYMESKGMVDQYVQFIKDVKNRSLSKAKQDRFLATEVPEGFINRQLNETQYIAKKVVEELTKVSYKVHSTSGQITSYLRQEWGLNDLLKTLAIEKYNEFGLGDNVVTFERENAIGQLHERTKIKDWSKRDDHRHHAIDALVVACTKQVYIQALNKLNTTFEENHQLKKSGYKVDAPFNHKQAKELISGILVSHRQNNKVVTRAKNTIQKKGGIAEQFTLTPRGALHKESVYGQIERYEKRALNRKFITKNTIVDKKGKPKEEILIDILKDGEIEKITDTKIKTALTERYIAAGRNLTALFKDLEKSPIYTDSAKKKSLKYVTITRPEFVLRYKLNDKFKPDDAEYIVDETIKKKVKAHLTLHNNNPKEAFNFDKNPLWLNENKGVPIKAVRVFTKSSELMPLHKNNNGRPMDFVLPYYKHHIAIYKDQEGKYHERVVDFVEAVKFKQYGLPAIITNPAAVYDKVIQEGIQDEFILQKIEDVKPGWQFVTSLQANDMYLLNSNLSELNELIAQNNYIAISKKLYRVQKIGSLDYTFRLHLETSVDKENQFFVRVKSLGRYLELNPIKVKLNKLGKIKSIENIL